MSGKIREKSGNFEVDDKWQPCTRELQDHSPSLTDETVNRGSASVLPSC